MNTQKLEEKIEEEIRCLTSIPKEYLSTEEVKFAIHYSNSYIPSLANLLLEWLNVNYLLRISFERRLTE